MAVTVTMKQMLEAGVHFGHQKRYWNPRMAPYIFGVHHNIHIINLEKSLPRFRDALKFIHNLAEKRGKIMFVGTKHAAREVVREEATRCGMPYVDYRWLGGMLTNYKTIRQSIRRLKDLESKLGNEDNIAGMTKKEILTLMREKDKLHANLSGIKNMGSLPDAIFVVDVGHEKIAIQEAKRLGITVIGIVDTNSSPIDVDIAIPGNDDAVRAIRFYSKAIADTILDVRESMELMAAKESKKEAVVTAEVKTEAPAKKKVVTKKATVTEEKTPAAPEIKAAAEPEPTKTAE
jgi:small subunit ribosomal protein S2